MIVALVPVLGRPANAQPLADSLAATSPGVRLVFLVSPDDPLEHDACVQTGADVIVMPWPRGPGDFAMKCNAGYRATTEPFVFQAADDVEFRPGWDDAILRVAEDTGAGVTGSNDLANPVVRKGRHSTHSLIRRSYVDHPGASADGPGTVFSEAYGHQWVDTELVQLAMHRNTWAFAKDSIVQHRHPFFDKTAKIDATYALGLSTSSQDARIFRNRSRAWNRQPKTFALAHSQS